MSFEEFLNVINDDKFDKEIYDSLIKNNDFKLISKYFSQLLNSDELSEDYYDKCKYYLEDDLNNIFDKSKDLSCLKQYLNEIGQYPLLTPEEEKTILIKLDGLKKIIQKYNDKYNIKELVKQNNINDKIEMNEYLKYEKDYEILSDKLIKSNLRLVVSIAKRYENYSNEILDLIQEGNIGLKIAVEKFDIEKGNRFTTYATWWIRQHIVREIQTNSRSIKLPVNQHELFYKVKRAMNLFEKEYNKIPTNEELINYIKIKIKDGTIKYSDCYDNLTPDKIEDLKTITQTITSINTKVGEEEDSTLEDFIVNEEESVENAVAKKMLKESIKTILDLLTPREKFIIILRNGMSLNKYMNYEEFCSCFNELKYDELYYKKLYVKICTKQKEYTLKEIAQNYGLTRERIRQIEAKALRKIRFKNKYYKILKPDFLDLYN